jgi:hypothetical protein
VEELPVETTLYSLTNAMPQRVERREGDRHLTLFRVGSLIIGDRHELCLIKNISAGGMLVRAYCAIAVGSRLSVELKCGDPVMGTAIWARGDGVGIEFDVPIDVIELLTNSMAGPRPRMPRIELSCIGWVRHEAISQRMQCCDISQGGIKITTTTQLPVDGQVMVTLPGLEPQAGVVCWKDGDAYGITFNRVVALPLLVGWIHEQRDRLLKAG